MTSEQPDYLSYLLRLWREDGKEPGNWRASLESALTGKRYVFPSLMELFAFLQRQTVAECDGTAPPCDVRIAQISCLSSEAVNEIAIDCHNYNIPSE